jgi:hypothetical protein
MLKISSWRGKIWNFFAKKRFSKRWLLTENQRLADAFQTVSEEHEQLKAEHAALQAEKENLEVGLRQVVPEFSRFVEFVLSRERPDDFGPDLKPIPEISAAQKAADVFKKYTELPLGKHDAIDVIVGALEIESGLPWEVLHRISKEFLTVAMTYAIERDEHGNITAASYRRLLEQGIPVPTPESLKS